MIFAQLANVILLPRIGPKPLLGLGLLVAAAGMVWLTGIGVHTSYATAVLGPMIVVGAGVGLSLPPAFNTGTYGVGPADAGVASATVNVGQQLGGSVGTALLNTIATSATASFLASRLTPAVAASPAARSALRASAAVHGFTTAFWWTAAIFAAGGVACGLLLRRGPLAPAGAAPSAAAEPGEPAVQRAAGSHART
jgi:hypothetical protein